MRGLGRSLWPSNRATRICTRVNSPIFSSSPISTSASPSSTSSTTTTTSSSSFPSSSSLNFSVKHVPFQPSPNGHTPHNDDATLELEQNNFNENSEITDNNENYNEDTNDNNYEDENNNNETENNFSLNENEPRNKTKLEGTRNLTPEAEERRSKALRYLESLESMQVGRKQVDVNYLLNAPNLSISHLDRIMVVGKLYDSVGIVEYGTFLTLMAKRGDLERVLAVFKEMSNRSIAPDVRCLNALMHACAANDKIDVMLTLARTRNSEWPEEFRSDPFGIICSYFVRKDLLDKAMEIVQEVKEKGFKINASVANPILYYLAKQLQPQLDDTGRKVYSLKPEKEAEIRKRFDDMIWQMQSTNGIPDSGTYFCRIQVLKGGSELEEGNKLLDEARDRGIQVDPKTYNMFISTLVTTGNIEAATGIITRMNAEDVMPDNATYSILISAFVKARALGALQALIPMITRPENKPRIWVYSNLVDALYKLGDVESSNAVLDYMRELGLKADVYTYNAILYRYHRTENRQVCVAIYEEMNRAGVLPDRATYDIMFHAYASMGNVEKSREMFDALLTICKPQSTVFFSMARLYLHENDYPSCLSILSLARQHGFGNLPTTTRIELLAYAGAHDLNGVVKSYKSARADGGPVTLTALAAYMATNIRHNVDVCEECLQEASKISVVFKPWHYQVMLEYLAKNQKWDAYNKVAEDYKANYRNSQDYREPDKELQNAKLSRITLPRKAYKSKKNPSSSPPPSSSPSNFFSNTPSPSPSIPNNAPSTPSTPTSSSPDSFTPSSLTSDSSSPSSLPISNSEQPQSPSQTQTRKQRRKNKSQKSSSSPSSASSQFIPSSAPVMPDYTQYQFGLFQQHYLPFQQYLSQLQQQHSQLQQQQIQQQQTHHLHNIFFQQSQENQTKPQQDNETAKETEKEKVRSKEGIPLTLANLQVQTHHAKLVGTAYNILLHDACLRGDLTRLGYILYYMAHSGLKVDGQAYSGLLTAALTHGDDTLASKVLSCMEAQGISADTHLYNVILACWNDRGEYGKIDALLHHMTMSSIPQDDVTRQIVAQVEEKKPKNNSATKYNDKEVSQVNEETEQKSETHAEAQ